VCVCVWVDSTGEAGLLTSSGTETKDVPGTDCLLNVSTQAAVHERERERERERKG
jgi:hypothetical protein